MIKNARKNIKININFFERFEVFVVFEYSAEAILSACHSAYFDGEVHCWHVGGRVSINALSVKSLIKAIDER